MLNWETLLEKDKNLCSVASSVERRQAATNTHGRWGVTVVRSHWLGTVAVSELQIAVVSNLKSEVGENRNFERKADNNLGKLTLCCTVNPRH